MNVVFLVIDTLRRDHLGCYGNPWIQTPNFDRLSQLGTTFDQCYLSSSPCMPARREILTGCHEWPFRGWGPLEPSDKDLFRLLGPDHLSMLITDHYHLFEHGAGNYHFGADGWEFIRGQENDAWVTDPKIEVHWPAPEYEKCHFRWQRYYRNTAQWRQGTEWASEDHTFTAQVFRSAANWVDRHAAEDGWCLFIDHFDPHEPFDPPAPYDTMYADDPPIERVRWPIYGRAERYDEREMRDIRALYAGKVTLVDRWLGYFIDRLETRGLLENTLLIVTTDHGHLFGEHGMIGKPGAGHGDSNLYQPMSHLPLWIVHPDIPGGRRHDALVQAVDYAPTMLEALGVTARPPMHGHSLLPLLQNPEARVRTFACGAKYGEGVLVTDGRYTLLEWPDGEGNEPLSWYSVAPPEFMKPRGVGEWDPGSRSFPIDHVRGPNRTTLYDTKLDPEQQRDLMAESPEVAARLREGLLGFLDSIDAPGEQAVRLGLRDG